MNEQPSSQDLMDAIIGVRGEVAGLTAEVGGLRGELSHLDAKIEHLDAKFGGKFDALNRKIDRRVDEVLATINEYATVTDRRIARLETFHA